MTRTREEKCLYPLPMGRRITCVVSILSSVSVALFLVLLILQSMKTNDLIHGMDLEGARMDGIMLSMGVSVEPDEQPRKFASMYIMRPVDSGNVRGEEVSESDPILTHAGSENHCVNLSVVNDDCVSVPVLARNEEWGLNP